MRALVLQSLNIVDYVCISNYITSIQAIKLIKPSFYIKGPDYKISKQDISGNIIKEKEAVELVGGIFRTTNNLSLSSTRYFNQSSDKFNLSQKKYLKKIYKKNYENKLVSWFEQIKDLKVLLIGETIIDEYVSTNVLGKAGKDPILTINPFKRRKYPGGILSIANIAAEFCKSVEIVTFLGDLDSEKSFINKNLKNNIKINYIIKKESPTILKTRYLDNEDRSKIIGIYNMNDVSLDNQEENNLSKLINKLTKKN